MGIRSGSFPSARAAVIVLLLVAAAVGLVGRAVAGETEAVLTFKKEFASPTNVFLNNKIEASFWTFGERVVRYTPGADPAKKDTLMVQVGQIGGGVIPLLPISQELDLKPGERATVSLKINQGMVYNTLALTLTRDDGGTTTPAGPAKPATVVSLEIAPGTVDQTVFVEPIETIPGLSRTFTVSRTFRTTLSVEASASLEAAGHMSAGVVGTELRSKIEGSVGVTIGQEDTVSESLTIDGDKITKVNVKWIERYRKGTVTLSDRTKIPFTVCIGLRIVPEAVK